MATLLEKANQILDEKNAKILSENIKSGIQVFDIAGNYTADADAVADNIEQGKTAYVNGEKVEGSLQVLGAPTDTASNVQYQENAMGNYLISSASREHTGIIKQGTPISMKSEASKVASAIGLTAEKLAKGNTILGIEGTAEVGGSDGIKLFETQEEMQADPNPQEGDLAVVYRSEVQNATADSKFQNATFPDTVVLDSAITDYVEVRYRAVDSSKMFDCWGELDSSRFRMNCYTDSGEIRIEYTSSDGITYNRTDTTGNPVDFGTQIYYERAEMWNNAIGKFIQVGGTNFGGMYEYKTNNNYLKGFKFTSTDMTTESLSYLDVAIPSLKEPFNSNGYQQIIITKYNNISYQGYNIIQPIDYLGFRWDRMIGDGLQVNKSDGNIIIDSDYITIIDKYTNNNYSETVTHPAKTPLLSDINIINSVVLVCKDYPNPNRILIREFPNKNNISVIEYTIRNYTSISTLNYLLADNQFNLTSSNELLPGKIAYGKNGVVMGNETIYDNLDISLTAKHLLPGIPTDSTSDHIITFNNRYIRKNKQNSAIS